VRRPTGPLGGLLKAAAALGAGGASIFGFAPWHAWPIAAAAILTLVWLLDDARQAPGRFWAGFWRAYAFAFAAFLAGLNWIGAAFFVDADKFAALAIPAIVALPAGLAVFWGLAGGLYARLAPDGPRRVLLFAGLFGLLEMARAHLFTGFPWNLLGYVWPAGGAVSQAAALIGAYGLTALTFLAFAGPAALWSQGGRRARAAFALAGPMVLAGLTLWGAVRLAGAASPGPDRPIVAVMDAGFTQAEMWRREAREVVPARYLALLDDPRAADAAIIVWPEGAMPFLLLEEETVLAAIGARLGDRVLAVGAPRRDVRGGAGRVFHNSLAVIGNDDRGLALRGLYDKHHLVPFGEYVPLGALFDALGLRSLVSYGVDFTPGPAAATLRLPGLPTAGPLICYEAIFPGFHRGAAERPQWLLNVSVDGWFGDGAGPHQHFNQARYRAIEEGTPLVRAASAGPSAIVDPYGRSVEGMARGPGVARAPLPKPLAVTAFAQGGEHAIWAFLALFVLTGLARPAQRD
jgi:apolipoprotein N-acyltransferase